MSINSKMGKVGKCISIKHGREEQLKLKQYNKATIKLVASPLVDGYVIQMSPDMFQESDEESVDNQSEVNSLPCNSFKPPSNLSSLYSQDNLSPDMFQESDVESVADNQSEVHSLSCNSGKPPSNLSSLYSQDNLLPGMFQESDKESVDNQSEVNSLSCNSGKSPSNLSSLYSQDNEQIEALSKKVVELESENGLLHNQIDDLNNQINHLKGELKQHSSGKRKRTSNEQDVMIPLVVGSHITVQRSELEKVKAIGRISKDKLNVMVNRLLEAIYSKSFLGSRSLSGGCPKKSKKNEASTNESRRPGLPKEDIKDIIVFVRKTWENIYGDVLPKIKCPIRLAIKSKLDTECRALKKYSHNCL